MLVAPTYCPGFATAPMGSEETCLYFNLCRELIEASWYWSESDDGNLAREANEHSLQQLVELLREVLDEWLNNAFEGGSSPSFMIECDRRRVPRGAGFAIQGIDSVQAESHMIDCACPICRMIVDSRSWNRPLNSDTMYPKITRSLQLNFNPRNAQAQPHVSSGWDVAP